MDEDSGLTVESTRPSSDDVERGEKHGVIEHKKCEYIEDGHKCGRPATMTCAACGMQICEYHTTRGRFCSLNCYQAAQLSGWGEKDVVEEEKGMSLLKKGLILIVLAVMAVAALVYAGVLDPVAIISMLPLP